MISAALRTDRPTRIVSMMTGLICSYARSTSKAVNTSRMIQTTVKDLIVPCSASSIWAKSWLIFDSSDFRGHQIDQREYEHPDQVDKMPVEAGYLDVFILKFAASHREGHDAEVNHSDDHVRHVKAGDPEESGPEQRLAPFVGERRHMLVVDQVQPFGE